MSTTAQVYLAYPSLLANGTAYNFTTASTYSFLLATSSYVPAPATHSVLSDVSTYEVATASYARKPVTVTGIANDTSNGLRTKVSASTITWSALTATFRYAVLFNSTTSGLIYYVDFGSDQVQSSATFTLTFSTGLLALMAPSVVVG